MGSGDAAEARLAALLLRRFPMLHWDDSRFRSTMTNTGLALTEADLEGFRAAREGGAGRGTGEGGADGGLDDGDDAMNGGGSGSGSGSTTGGALGAAGGGLLGGGGADWLARGSGPSKTLRTPATVAIGCRVMVIDASSRAEPPAVRTILEEAAPQSIVLLTGSSAAAARLADHAAAFCDVVHAGEAGKALDVSSHDASTTVALRSALYATTPFRRTKAFDVAYLEAVPDAFMPAAAARPGGGEDDPVAVLASLPPSVPPGHAPVLARAAGVRIADVRRRLGAKGIACDVFEGGLVTAGGIVVHRGDAPGAAALHHLQVEGPLCDEYYAVRDAVYGLYVVV